MRVAIVTGAAGGIGYAVTQRLIENGCAVVGMNRRAYADVAEKLQTGARGLRTVCERFMTQVMFDVPNEKNLKKITITPEVVMGTAKPIYEYSISHVSAELMPLKPLAARATSPYTDDGEEGGKYGKSY